MANEKRIERARKRAAEKGRELSKAEITDLYRTANLGPSVGSRPPLSSSPLDRRTVRRTVPG